MLTHYLLIAVRNVERHRFTTLVAVAGLALGLACFIGARLFVSHIDGAERHFPNAERIYVVHQTSSWAPIGLEVPFGSSVTPLIAERLRSDYPQIEAIARSRAQPRTSVTVDGQRSLQRIQFVDPAFFEIFTPTYTAGSSRDFASAARTAILTEPVAVSLFGTSDVVGRSLHIDPAGDVEIGAVIAPFPHPSHLAGTFGDDGAGIFVVTHIDEDLTGRPVFGSEAPTAPPRETIDAMMWLGFGGTVTTYLLLPEDGSLTAAELNAAFPDLVARHVTIQDGSTSFEVVHVSRLLGAALDDTLGPFTAISLTDLLQALGALVLATACLNFVNLTTARAAVRGKEIGLRKTLGARRGQLIAQHLAESTLVAAAAAGVALIVVQAGSVLLGRSFEVNLPTLADAGGWFWLSVAVLTVAVGAAGGLYPAFVLARVEPIAAIRAGSIRVGSSMLRTVLIGMQFAAASFLLIVVTVVAAQNAALARSGPSPNADSVVVITTSLSEAGIDPELFRERLEASPSITAVTGADVPPWEGYAGGTGYSRVPDDIGSFRFTQTQRVTYGYFEVLGTELVAGRTFSRERGDADISSEVRVVIDRLAAEQFGWPDPEAAVGQTIFQSSLSPGQFNARTVIGVVEHDPARVFGWGSRAFVYSPDENGITYPIIRIAEHDVPAALAHIDATWDALSPDVPISREFIDERFEQAYSLFRTVITAFAVLAVIALAIAVMGLLGMVLFVVARRRHEMGVRKALGASPPRIMQLLVWQFVRPVLIANVAVWPLGLVAARLYVDIFMKPISVTPLPFVASLAITVLTTGAVVGWQALASARTKPATVLRHE